MDMELQAKLARASFPRKHPKLVNLKTSEPNHYKEGLDLMTDFINSEKLVPISREEACTITNFYVVHNGRRSRPVFPLLRINQLLSDRVKQTNFTQASLSSLMMRLRLASEIVVSDVSEAYMSVHIGQRLSKYLVVDCSDLGLVTKEGSPARLMKFQNMTNGLGMAPQVLEKILYSFSFEFGDGEQGVATCEDWVDSETRAMLNSYMDDVSTSKGQFRLNAPKLVPVQILEEQKLEAIKGTLMGKVVGQLEKKSLSCKPSKLQFVTASGEAETFGVVFENCGEFIRFKKTENLKEELGEVVTFRAALAYLAGLMPCITEVIPPWSYLIRNQLQQVVGLLIADGTVELGYKANDIPKTVRAKLWDQSIPKDLEVLLRAYQDKFTTPESLQWKVHRGLDLTEELHVYVDSSKNVIGYMAMQRDRLLWYQQAAVSRLGSWAMHINVKETLSISFSLIDICTRFTAAKIKLPKIVVHTDSKTALSSFRRLRVNSDSGDMIQRAAIAKLLDSVASILSPEFLRNEVQYEFVAGEDNPADSLTRDELFDKVNAYTEKILKNRKPSDCEVENPTVDAGDSPAEAFVWAFIKLKHVTEHCTEKFSSEVPKPQLPPVIHQYMLLRKVLDRWKANHDLKKVRCSVQVVLFRLEQYDHDGIGAEEDRESLFLKMQAEASSNQNLTTDADGVVRCRRDEELGEKPKLFLPSREITHYVVARAHAQNGHCKFDTLLSLVRSTFTSDSLRSVCKQVCASCWQCSVTTRLKPKPQPVETVRGIPAGPGKKICIDIFGPVELPEELEMPLKTGTSTSTSPRYFLTIIDFYSKRRWLMPLVGSSAAAVRTGLLVYFQSEGYPTVVVSDNGSSLKALGPWLASCGVNVHYTQVYAPHTHGLVERVHKDLNESIRAVVSEGGKEFWLDALFNRVLVQNLTSFTIKGREYSPSSVSLKSKPQLPNHQGPWEATEDLMSTWSDWQKDYAKQWHGRREKNREQLLKNKSRLRVDEHHPGDSVLVYKEPRYKHDVCWKSGTIKCSDEHGYVLTDGSKHTAEHVKKAPPEAEAAYAAGNLKLGDLVLNVNLNALGQVAKVDRLTVKVVPLDIMADYSVRVLPTGTWSRAEVTVLDGKLESKPRGGDKLFLSRTLSGQLRKMNPHFFTEKLRLERLGSNGFEDCSAGDRHPHTLGTDRGSLKTSEAP
jgi:hypothetical protein